MVLLLVFVKNNTTSDYINYMFSLLFLQARTKITSDKKSKVNFSFLNIFLCPFENKASDPHLRNALSLFLRL